MQTKNFRRKIHHKQSRLRKENGFGVVGWFPFVFPRHDDSTSLQAHTLMINVIVSLNRPTL
jgi:hypothetical protein